MHTCMLYLFSIQAGSSEKAGNWLELEDQALALKEQIEMIVLQSTVGDKQLMKTDESDLVEKCQQGKACFSRRVQMESEATSTSLCLKVQAET